MATNQQVAHAWAHQTGRQRNGHNLSYDGPVLTSYGWYVIGRLVTAPDGRAVALIRADKYSPSTGRHITYALRATSHLPTFLVEDPSRESHDADHERFIVLAAESVDKARRARTSGDMHLNYAVRLCTEANRYAETFGLDKPRVTLDTLASDIAAVRARAAAQKAADREKRAARERERAVEEAAMRDAWLAGEPNRWYGRAADGTALLRVKGDVLETSQGASVPLAHAIRAFRFVKHVKATGNAWHRNGHSIRVGHFAVDAIDTEGNMRAGCHTIAWSEIERIATVVGVLADDASTDALEPSGAAA